jgi:hypothetical protein
MPRLLHDGDDALRRLRVTQAARDPVVDEDDGDVATGGGPQQVGLTLGRRGRDEELLDDVRRRVENFGNGVRSFDQKSASGRPLPCAQELSGGRDA